MTYESPTFYLRVSDYRVERCFFKVVFLSLATSTIRRSHNVNIDTGKDYFVLVYSGG